MDIPTKLRSSWYCTRRIVSVFVPPLTVQCDCARQIVNEWPGIARAPPECSRLEIERRSASTAISGTAIGQRNFSLFLSRWEL